MPSLPPLPSAAPTSVFPLSAPPTSLFSLSDLSVWAVLPVLLLAAAVVVLHLTDPRFARRYVRSFVPLLVQLLLMAAYAWALFRLSHWAADVAGYCLLVVVTTGLHPYGRRHWLPLLLSVSVADALAVGSLLLAFQALPTRTVFIVSSVLLVLHLTSSTASSLRTFEVSHRVTRDHIIYLLANGATQMEALMPSVRRALRPGLLWQLRHRPTSFVVMLPVLMAALLLGGFSPAAALAVTLLFALAALGASILSAATALWLSIRRSAHL